MARRCTGILLMWLVMATAMPVGAADGGGCLCECVPRVGLRTNMLLDAALIPNIGVEIPIGRRMSVLAGWGYAWWSDNDRHFCWSTYGGEIELRYFLGDREGKNRLAGHHIGIYGQAGTYDFCLKGKGRQSPHWNYGGGISYGYTLPVSRRLSIDFTIGIGYAGGKYYKYEAAGGRYVWLATKERRYIGPTRCVVALVWLIGSGNVNPSKNRYKP